MNFFRRFFFERYLAQAGPQPTHSQVNRQDTPWCRCSSGHSHTRPCQTETKRKFNHYNGNTGHLSLRQQESISVGEHSSEGLSENHRLYNATSHFQRLLHRASTGTPQWTVAEQQCTSSQQDLREQLLLHTSHLISLTLSCSSSGNIFGNFSNASNILSWTQPSSNQSAVDVELSTNFYTTYQNKPINIGLLHHHIW